MVDNTLTERRLRWLGRMICGWTTSPYHKHCTGRLRYSEEDQVGQGQTGGAQSSSSGSIEA